MLMFVTENVKYVGVDDHTIDLFEGLYPVPNGMAYNSYIILDEKIAVMDTVDEAFTNQWLDNISSILKDRKPDFLIIQHMEPDHSANIVNFMNQYPETIIVASNKAFIMMKNFFGVEFKENQMVVSDGDVLSLGKHKLKFITAPMVHWPEVIMTYDNTDKILFSADAFGKFGALDVTEDWIDEARRYYIGIVGKYGVQVQNLLKKIKDLDIQMICSLHGPVLTKEIGYYVKLYDTWSSYRPEEEGVLIAYTSVYGNTKKAVMSLEAELREKGCTNVIVKDLIRSDMTEIVAEAFKYSKIVLATTTYNADVFPPMREFINRLIERNFCNRTVAFMGNGSWASGATMKMREMLEKCKGLSFVENNIKIISVLNEECALQIELLAEELCKDN